ncbi:MAG: hypothetical protein M1837_005905 [Sclerophora amabilis]|nr:MAG: hypothetical protein M1837_005905 [Sclerophora amabilis]
MAPNETSILGTFLLTPAPLPTVLSLRKFTDFFPRAQRSNPQIPILYRELQHQRALVLDRVKKNIKAEAKRGEVLSREVSRARQRSEREELGMDGNDLREVGMEIELFGPASNLPQSKPHTYSTLLPEMESACSDLESEISEINIELEVLLKDMKGTVDNLSDLRYGKLSRPSGGADSIGQEVIEGLKSLQRACDDAEDT